MDNWTNFFPTERGLNEMLATAEYKFNGDGTRPDVLLFVYTHHLNPGEFKAQFRSAKFVGLAWLPAWQLHINQHGEPNIRPSPRVDFSPNQNGVLGCAFVVSANDDDRYLQHSSRRGNRNRRNERVLIRHSPIVRRGTIPPPGVTYQETPQVAMIYWDPRHTVATGLQWHPSYEMEMTRWTYGVQTLRNWCIANNFVPNGSPLDIPMWYIDMLRFNLHAGRLLPPPLPQPLATPDIPADPEREAREEEVFGPIPYDDPVAPLFNMATIQRKPQLYEIPVPHPRQQ